MKQEIVNEIFPDKWKDITSEISWRLNKNPAGGYCFHGYLNKEVIIILDCTGPRKLEYPYSKDVKLVKNSNNSFAVLKEVV